MKNEFALLWHESVWTLREALEAADVRSTILSLPPSCMTRVPGKQEKGGRTLRVTLQTKQKEKKRERGHPLPVGAHQVIISLFVVQGYQLGRSIFAKVRTEGPRHQDFRARSESQLAAVLSSCSL